MLFRQCPVGFSQSTTDAKNVKRWTTIFKAADATQRITVLSVHGVWLKKKWSLRNVIFRGRTVPESPIARWQCLSSPGAPCTVVAQNI